MKKERVLPIERALSREQMKGNKRIVLEGTIWCGKVRREETDRSTGGQGISRPSKGGDGSGKTLLSSRRRKKAGQEGGVGGQTFKRVWGRPAATSLRTPKQVPPPQRDFRGGGSKPTTSHVELKDKTMYIPLGRHLRVESGL